MNVKEELRVFFGNAVKLEDVDYYELRGVISEKLFRGILEFLEEKEDEE